MVEPPTKSCSFAGVKRNESAKAAMSRSSVTADCSACAGDRAKAGRRGPFLEVIDLRSIKPLTKRQFSIRFAKTHRVVIVDKTGRSAESVRSLLSYSEKYFRRARRARSARITRRCTMPYNERLEKAVLPNAITDRGGEGVCTREPS